MKFYIASKFSNKDFVMSIIDELEWRYGWSCTFNWTRRSKEWDKMSKLDMIINSAREGQAVRRADLFILLHPGAYGTNTELGIRIGAGRRAYIFRPRGEMYPNIFYYHPKVKVIVIPKIDSVYMMARTIYMVCGG